MHLRHAAAGLLLAALAAGGIGVSRPSADDTTQPAPAQEEPAPAQEESAWAGGDAKRGSEIFSSNGCGWCHEGMGRKQGRGPQLMDTPRSDDFIAARISNGQAGRMPAFGSSLDTDQISDLIAFIHSIKPEGQ